jgi:hypothetical protein
MDSEKEVRTMFKRMVCVGLMVCVVTLWGDARGSAPTEPLLAQPDQQVSLDLKALVLSRLEDLLKASEQMAKDRSIDLATLTDPLKEFKKLFEANKIVDASLQLNAIASCCGP